MSHATHDFYARCAPAKLFQIAPQDKNRSRLAVNISSTRTACSYQKRPSIADVGTRSRDVTLVYVFAGLPNAGRAFSACGERHRERHLAHAKDASWSHAPTSTENEGRP
jgi:hypothetical protein